MLERLWSRISQAWKDRPRRRTLIVTDLTRMEGQRVCLGGYLEDGRAVRPVVARFGPDEAWLARADGGPVAPFSVVELRIAGKPKGAHAPHTEDRLTPERGHRVLRALPETEQVSLLERTCSPAVDAMFGAPVLADDAGGWGRFVRAGTGTRSLGTVRAADIEGVSFRHYPDRGRWDYRLRFRDEAGAVYQLAVVDLAFRGRLDALRAEGLPPEEAARRVQAQLRGQRVYLRVGLARGWEKHPDRCYLQLTGVYGFDGAALG